MQPNHFELLQVPVRFEQADQTLEEHWKAASARVHPDRFATASAAEKRVAVQWAARINEAYQCLKDPLQRALYLCALGGHPLDMEQNTVKDPQLLMQQMELREALDEAQTPEARTALRTEVEGQIQALVADLQPQLDALVAATSKSNASADSASASGAAPADTTRAPEGAAVDVTRVHQRLCEWMFLSKFLRSMPAL